MVLENIVVETGDEILKINMKTVHGYWKKKKRGDYTVFVAQIGPHTSFTLSFEKFHPQFWNLHSLLLLVLFINSMFHPQFRIAFTNAFTAAHVLFIKTYRLVLLE
jgi:hypothetical protein